MKKLLLHACCAPCSTAVIERLQGEYDLTVFFYNPCIEPEEEYLRRLAELERLLGILNLPLIEGAYEPDRYLDAVRGLEHEPEGGARCAVCFEQRLAAAAALPGYDLVTTTLTVSPHKNAALINGIGKKLCGDRWLHSDFKKQNGYLRSIELSKQYGLYRQNFCGCVFSSRG
ncbi:MAG TPA: epoxyqueuosine reductase QueH [Candidatus Acidoferrum sp.]|nr:epoxyqueuosine reductase QueH [Candidatus Acidoferrum sp.]